MINIRQWLRTNGLHPNESRDRFNVTYELMLCDFIIAHVLLNRMNYLKWNISNMSRGDLNFTFSVNSYYLFEKKYRNKMWYRGEW